MNLRRRRVVLLLLPALFVLAACGGSGKASATSGSVPVGTATTSSPSCIPKPTVVCPSPPTRRVTYVEPVATMEPTIQCGRGTSDLGKRNVGCTGVADDHVVVEEPAPPIRRLDIIVFHRPREADVICGAGQPFIQRVIGLPGDVVHEDDHGFIWIKIPGAAKFVKLNEPYVSASRRGRSQGEAVHTWQVPNGAYFTAADNRRGGCDSRGIGNGLPAARTVIGKVVGIIPSSG